MSERTRISKLTLDERTVVRRSPDIEHERNVAIYDLIEENHFAPACAVPGPYHVTLAVEENRLAFEIRTEEGGDVDRVLLPLSPFRRLVKEYFLICESYYDAIKRGTRAQIETLDMGRKGLHDEGSELLRERLAGKIAIDFNTARRLFTLVCVLHIRG